MANSITYDAQTISDAEIIAAGIDKSAPDLEIRALREGMKSAETKDSIEQITNGVLDGISESEAKYILRGAAALTREKRKVNAPSTVKTQDHVSFNSITCDDINRMNQDFYK